MRELRKPQVSTTEPPGMTASMSFGTALTMDPTKAARPDAPVCSRISERMPSPPNRQGSRTRRRGAPNIRVKIPRVQSNNPNDLRKDRTIKTAQRSLRKRRHHLASQVISPWIKAILIILTNA